MPSPAATPETTLVYPSASYATRPAEFFQPVTGSHETPPAIAAPAVEIHRFQNVKVWHDGTNTHILDYNGNTLYHYGVVDPAKIAEEPVQHLSGETVLLGSNAANNYYHWSLDILPKFHILDKAGYDVNSCERLLVKRFGTGFQKEMLNNLEISLDCIYQGESFLFQCDSLVQVDLQNTLGLTSHPFIQGFLKTTNLPAEIPSSNRRKIYIKRRDNLRRQVLNEQQVLDLLLQHDFEIHELEELSVADQAALFNSADIIIASHGAALANLVYCEEGSTVIELFGSHVYSHYYGLSQMCKLRYIPILTYPEKSEAIYDLKAGLKYAAEDMGKTIGRDIELNVDVFRRVLDNLISSNLLKSAA